ncbi:MAG: AMP-binding protein [Deltaproteobacteria bacterium]|nr:AMP-binding protein [Deltaproteobacteria bacterium]
MDQTAIAEVYVAKKNNRLYTVSDLLLQQAQSGHAKKTAIVDGQRRIDYSDLLRLALGYAAVLKKAGLQKGDRVGIFLRRSIEAVVALFATHSAGGVAVIIADVLHSKQVEHILAHSEALLMLTDSRQLLQVPALGFDRQRIINMDEIVPGRAAFSPVSAIGNDLALLIYTSGSTGLPKGVMVSHSNLLSGAMIVSDYLRVTEEDTLISLLPFSFDYGLNQLLMTLFTGGTLVIQRSLFPAEVCRTAQKDKITGIAGVPTLWLQLTGAYSPFLNTSFPHLRYITNSGGSLPESVIRQIRKSHPQVEIFLMYGLTEAFRSTFLPPDQVDIRPSSIGKAIPNVEILVLHEGGRLCRPGEVGELIHRGATVTLGYWRDPEATARVFRPHPLTDYGNGRAEIVAFSGDLVKTDSDGYLYFVGRRDQLIKTRGYRLSPEEIERWAFGSGLLANAVAFAVPKDPVDSHIVLAVTPKETDDFGRQAFDRYCRNEMPEYMRPHDVWVLNEFPLTSAGKPDRVRIKQTYVETR